MLNADHKFWDSNKWSECCFLYMEYRTLDMGLRIDTRPVCVRVCVKCHVRQVEENVFHRFALMTVSHWHLLLLFSIVHFGLWCSSVRLVSFSCCVLFPNYDCGAVSEIVFDRHANVKQTKPNRHKTVFDTTHHPIRMKNVEWECVHFCN